MHLTRIDYRRLAKEAALLIAELDAIKLDEPPQELALRLKALVPSASREQIERALRKALRKRRGEQAPRSGTPPNFHLVLNEKELAFVRQQAQHYGSQAGVVHAALARMMEQGMEMISDPDIRQMLANLRAQLPDLATRYRVSSLGLFGSYVRGEQAPGSDLDVLVTFHEPPSLFEFTRLKHELTDLLGVPVDLVMQDGLKPAIGKQILSEVVVV